MVPEGRISASARFPALFRDDDPERGSVPRRTTTDTTRPSTVGEHRNRGPDRADFMTFYRHDGSVAVRNHVRSRIVPLRDTNAVYDESWPLWSISDPRRSGERRRTTHHAASAGPTPVAETVTRRDRATDPAARGRRSRDRRVLGRQASSSWIGALPERFLHVRHGGHTAVDAAAIDDSTRWRRTAPHDDEFRVRLPDRRRRIVVFHSHILVGYQR